MEERFATSPLQIDNDLDILDPAASGESTQAPALPAVAALMLRQLSHRPDLGGKASTCRWPEVLTQSPSMAGFRPWPAWTAPGCGLSGTWRW